MDWNLGKSILLNMFTRERRMFRSFSVKRVLMLLFFVPFFFLLLIWNRFFMALDAIVFPGFKDQPISNPVFIIAMPRSGTTFLHHTLVSSNQFSYFKLWEMLFAPAICQKYFFIAINRLDKKIGQPIRSIILFFEGWITGDFKKIHLLGLNLPDEDELLLLWNLSTAYLHFVVPHRDSFKAYFYFDELMKAEQQERILSFYAACVKRHEYVFNRNGSKLFLAKNPLMIPKGKAVAQFFPNAKCIAIERSAKDCLASTLSLNAHLYGVFSAAKNWEEPDEESIDVLMDWYQKSLIENRSNFYGRYLSLEFENIVKPNNQVRTGNQIAAFLNLKSIELNKFSINKLQKHKSKHRHWKLTEDQLQRIERLNRFVSPPKVH